MNELDTQREGLSSAKQRCGDLEAALQGANNVADSLRAENEVSQKEAAKLEAQLQDLKQQYSW